jgi:hypothetical protein
VVKKLLGPNKFSAPNGQAARCQIATAVSQCPFAAATFNQTFVLKPSIDGRRNMKAERVIVRGFFVKRREVHFVFRFEGLLLSTTPRNHLPPSLSTLNRQKSFSATTTATVVFRLFALLLSFSASFAATRICTV